MLGNKSDKTCNSARLCPISFGLAIGVASFFAVLIWMLYIMSYGLPQTTMIAMHMPMPTLSMGFIHALFALVKGFVFGFVVALLYNAFSCCCRKKCETIEPKK